MQLAGSADQYQIYMAMEGAEIVVAMGVRVLYDFVHGKHLYIDDVVAKSTRRAKGIGAEMLKFSETLAKSRECLGLRLSTGVTDEGAKRFCEREGWNLKSVTYKKSLTP